MGRLEQRERMQRNVRGGHDNADALVYRKLWDVRRRRNIDSDMHSWCDVGFVASKSVEF